MNHQDWTSVVINKSKGPVQKDIVEKTGAAKNSQPSTSQDAKVLANLANTDEIVVPLTASKAVGSQIRDARMSEGNKQKKKLSQNDLDKLCGFPAKTVQKYENNTAIYNQQEVDKMSKILGMQIKKHGVAK